MTMMPLRLSGALQETWQSNLPQAGRLRLCARLAAVSLTIGHAQTTEGSFDPIFTLETALGMISGLDRDNNGKMISQGAAT